MGNYAAFGFGNPRFGNWATHGLGLTTFVPPAAEPTYPPLRTFIVVRDELIPVVRDPACFVVPGMDPCLVPRESIAKVARDVDIKVNKEAASRSGRDDAIKVIRYRRTPIKRDD